MNYYFICSARNVEKAQIMRNINVINFVLHDGTAREGKRRADATRGRFISRAPTTSGPRERGNSGYFVRGKLLELRLISGRT